MRPTLLALSLLLLRADLAAAQEAVPLVDDVELAPLREQGARLLKALASLQSPLSADEAKELQAALRDDGKDAPRDIQKVLDRHCLFVVTINPESRVKAAGGSAGAQLVRDQPTYVLVKVLNDAGVTAPLKVEGEQLRDSKNEDAGRWLDAAVVTAAPLTDKLSGFKVEYVLLRLTPQATGKREATFRFDVGQGTQDLGFRAEVPVLFTVRAQK